MNNILENYADAIITSGVNIQKGQSLIIQASVEAIELTRLCVKKAYEKGAKEVQVFYRDDTCEKYHYYYKDVAVIENIRQWQIDCKLDYFKEGACVLHLISDVPGIFKHIASSKISAFQMSWGKASKEIRSYTMANKAQWCIAAYPNNSWAKMVFPNSEKPQDELLRCILDSCHIKDDNDANKAWKDHNAAFKKRVDILNKYNFKALKFKNELGTDVEIQLVNNHIWAGGSEYTTGGVEFNPNMPTEEIFTMPLKEGVNGKVVASKALDYNGVLIEDFYFIFKNGKVIEYNAVKGKEALDELISFDEGSCYLGEVALVPYNSPISISNILFYNTLFDENASCHLALGDAYPSNLAGGVEMSEAQLKEHGANHSMTHVDFMFGSKDMSIVGIGEDNREIDIFKMGDFTF